MSSTGFGTEEFANKTKDSEASGASTRHCCGRCWFACCVLVVQEVADSSSYRSNVFLIVHILYTTLQIVFEGHGASAPPTHLLVVGLPQF